MQIHHVVVYVHFMGTDARNGLACAHHQTSLASLSIIPVALPRKLAIPFLSEIVVRQAPQLSALNPFDSYVVHPQVCFPDVVI